MRSMVEGAGLRSFAAACPLHRASRGPPPPLRGGGDEAHWQNEGASILFGGEPGMRQIERGIEAAIVMSRWLLLPLLFGLVLGLLVLVGRFFADFYEILAHVRSSTGHDVIIGLLNLIDFALTANLMLIVIFSGYENFIRRIDPAEHPHWPEGITQVDFGALKQKLLGSVVAIATVDALGWYLELEKTADTSKLGWAIGFPLAFVVSMLMLAIAERLGHGAPNQRG
jgi:uncharacterized protein (TIGR00645 family)